MPKWQRKKRSPLLILGSLAAATYALIALFGDEGLLKLRHMQQRAASLEVEIAKIEAENQRLAYEIDQLENRDHLEKVVREELGYLRPDEVIYYIEESRP